MCRLVEPLVARQWPGEGPLARVAGYGPGASPWLLEQHRGHIRARTPFRLWGAAQPQPSRTRLFARSDHQGARALAPTHDLQGAW